MLATRLAGAGGASRRWDCEGRLLRGSDAERIEIRAKHAAHKRDEDGNPGKVVVGSEDLRSVDKR